VALVVRIHAMATCDAQMYFGADKQAAHEIEQYIVVFAVQSQALVMIVFLRNTGRHNFTRGTRLDCVESAIHYS